ncbi:hypothetical protein BX600DRAFT_383834 [Xylariales sp. PMI_506]|nr:hypothetical protein BX600DRAFT_383834 [Xylariales sp. PMI_506]
MQFVLGILVFGSALCSASITLLDPSDIINPALWADDNAIIPDYNVAFPSTQPSAIEAAYSWDGESVSIDHETYTVDANDTSVILVANDGSLDASYIDVIKYGYGSNLLYSSFWGFNAAINVANASTANLDNVNVTVHNGAANVYAYGSNTLVNVNNSWLYSSGPVSHGLYASGNATIVGRNIQHFSGGRRSSAFAGDSPAGYVYVYDSVAHTQGIGSAAFYALGTVYGENVVSLSENAPVIFMDGVQNATLVDSDCTAGLLGGVAIFSSQVRQTGGKLELINSKITTLGDEIPGLWFGNTIVNVTIASSEIVAPSGLLIVANYSQITQDFDYYAGYPDNNNLLPAEVYTTVTESDLNGDLVPYNGSYISFSLASYSTWNGAAYAGYGVGLVDVSLDATSNWTLTQSSTVQQLSDDDATLSNIDSAGFTLYYNATLNDWLGGQTLQLTGGGSATPIA